MARELHRQNLKLKSYNRIGVSFSETPYCY